MDNIIEPNETFDFTKLSLAHPSGIQGGAYFTKILYNTKPLYIQTANSLTRQGFVKSGKKYYCDLMFDNTAESMIHWFENLEDKCQKLLLEKNDAWFQNSLTSSDIECAFTPTLRVYKSGKYYLIRTNIKNTPTGEPNIKIFNENEVTLGINDISNETNIISILEIQGIKFTSRSFQIDIDLKQVMVVDKTPIFDNCVIKTNKPKPFTKPLELSLSHVNQEPLVTQDEVIDVEDQKSEVIENEVQDKIDNLFGIITESQDKPETDQEPLVTQDEVIDVEDQKNEVLENELLESEVQDKIDNLFGMITESQDKPETDEEVTLEVEELGLDDIKEVSMEVNLDDLDSITLKKPNEVYFELYREARNKAKQAKRSAIIAYLEAKNIKKTYMLDNLNDSDSEFDAEIDEASESELEGL